jgi:hypothetical protein
MEVRNTWKHTAVHVVPIVISATENCTEVSTDRPVHKTVPIHCMSTDVHTNTEGTYRAVEVVVVVTVVV